MKLDDKTYHEIRETVISFLLFLTSDRCAELLHRYTSPGSLAFEMCRIWFERIYLPGITYVDGLKGDRDQEKAELFFEAFDPEETDALERFHRFWELRLEMLPEKYKKAEKFPDNTTWTNIRRDAAYLLQELAPDTKQRQLDFSKAIEEIERKHNNQLGSGDMTPLYRLLPGNGEQ